MARTKNKIKDYYMVIGKDKNGKLRITSGYSGKEKKGECHHIVWQCNNIQDARRKALQEHKWKCKGESNG